MLGPLSSWGFLNSEGKDASSLSNILIHEFSNSQIKYATLALRLGWPCRLKEFSMVSHKKLYILMGVSLKKLLNLSHVYQRD